MNTTHTKVLLAIASLVLCGATDAAQLTGRVSPGLVVSDPGEVVTALQRAPSPDDESQLFVGWTVDLVDGAEIDDVAGLRDLGVRPWVRVVFATPAPVIDHMNRLERELAVLAGLAGAAGPETSFQAIWRPETGEPTARDHGYLIKRAAVVVTGAATGASFAAGPLPPEPAFLRELYEEEVAAYLDAVVFAPGDGWQTAAGAIAELDPGKPLVADAVVWPAGGTPLPNIAAAWAAGAALVFADATTVERLEPAPLVTAANEFAGGLVFDPTARPTGVDDAWAFVGEDLSLRIVASRDPAERRLRLVFGDTLLRDPELVDLTTGDASEVTGVSRPGEFVVVVADPPDVALIRLERATADEADGFDEEIEVGGGRQMPVEEILRRLQAFEDDQARRLENYTARREMNLRFQGTGGSIDLTYAGEFFYRDGSFDWVWSEFFIGGVKWRSRKMPKVPLIQPEKVGSLPVEIRLEKDYEYRLRGTAEVDGRDCWVIDFKPVTVEPGASRFQGTVWVDREVYARVRTRAVQVGLSGDVLSNEETYFFTPIDELGNPAPWSQDSFVLPLRISGQQVFTLLNNTLPVEVENRFTGVRINNGGFDTALETAMASDVTMVRETDEGLRYLNKDKSGNRVVETDFDSDRLFLVGGVFWDESVDYPIPAIGVNYLDLDLKGSGAQVNLFFAGAFLTANIADPDFLGSRWNTGLNLNGVFINRRDELYRDGEVVPEENVRSRTGEFNLFAGRPFAKFFSLEMKYKGRYTSYGEDDETADDFVLPQSTLVHTALASIDYNRRGYRVAVAGSVNRRSSWEFWGLPGNTEYSDDQRQFERWQINFAKTWWLKRFHKIVLTVEHLDSSNTDRFSGYDFGLFGDVTVAGYPSGLVRAERASGAHLRGGLNVMELIRMSVGVDAIWASNEATGLDNELLAGIGVGGTLTLPWQLIMDFDLGYAFAGPGEGGFAMRVFFLKLFPKS
jgi:hypothetical protein